MGRHRKVRNVKIHGFKKGAEVHASKRKFYQHDLLNLLCVPFLLIGAASVIALIIFITYKLITN